MPRVPIVISHSSRIQSCISALSSTMDPLSALSLACNIIDLVSKAIKGVVAIVEVSKSANGVSNANETINREADGLKGIVEDLRGYQSQPAYETADRKVQEISTTLISRCDELQKVLNGCKSSRRFGILSATNAYLKVLHKKEDIEHLQNNIVSSRDELFRWIAKNTHARVNDIMKGLATVTQTSHQIQITLDDVDAQLRKLGDTSNLTENGATVGVEEIREGVADRVILQLLYFRDLGSRLEGVVVPEQGTFEWIFTDPEVVLRSHPRLGMTFPQWLESGDGIFHICGKPGSGKSTLMKYIYSNPTAMKQLAKWSQRDELLTGYFFFWRPGAPEQKNMRGLIRGLLYQILYQVPKLCRKIFSKETRDRLLDGLQKHYGIGLSSAESSSARLSFDEIMAAFSRLVKISTGSSRDQDFRGIRICLFIDGLDEFDTAQINQSHRKLVEKLFQWTKDSGGKIKICVSSRIEEPFMGMLDESKRFALQNLTKGDIELFIEKSFVRHSRFLVHQLKSPKECKDLVRKIRESAEGVFLWVALVVKDIEAGLDDGISIKRLERIVSEKPKELDDLLRQIISSIGTASRRGVEVLLSAMLRATGTLLSPKQQIVRPIAYGRPGDNEEFNFSALSALLILQAADKGMLMQGDIDMNEFDLSKEVWFQDNMTDEEILEVISNIVRTRCRGLIDVFEQSHDKKVQFMHRSVPEFLLTYFTNASTPISDYSSTTAMSWATLIDLKWHFFNNHAPYSLSSFLRGKPTPQLGNALKHLKLEKAEYIYRPSLGKIKDTKLGDEWEDLYRILVSIDETIRGDNRDFLVECVRVGLHEFLDWVFRKTAVLTDETRLCRVLISASNCDQPAIIETVFTHGIDGRIVFPLDYEGDRSGKPVWHKFLLNIIQKIRAFDPVGKHDYEEVSRMATAIEVWLRYGADPRVRLWLLESGLSVGNVPDDSVSRWDGGPPNPKFHIPLELQRKGRDDFSLRDLVLYLKPHNESLLLDLLGGDVEDDVDDVSDDDTEDAQGPPRIEAGLSGIDSHHDRSSNPLREAAISLQHPEVETVGKEDGSVVHPNGWLRGWPVQGVPAWMYIHLALVGVLGFIIGYLVRFPA
ncbi:hypothetical protein GGR51DRAFT_522080 [Nemania sp. FL0031]|nr:hypothetical protein GGR51DRAFT_522080 [Nemania sp. FL0031]